MLEKQDLSKSISSTCKVATGIGEKQEISNFHDGPMSYQPMSTANPALMGQIWLAGNSKGDRGKWIFFVDFDDLQLKYWRGHIFPSFKIEVVQSVFLLNSIGSVSS